MLNDLSAIERLDSRRMFKALHQTPEQCSNAMLSRVDLPNGYTRVQNVVITGMGASGIGANLASALLGPRIEVPIVVNKGYDVPAFVDHRTLLLVVSYSGDTEETIAACSAGLTHGAKVVIFTTDGILQKMARETGLPLVTIPRGLRARSALGYLFFPLLSVLRAAELIDTVDGEGELVSLLNDRRHVYEPNSNTEHNPAKQLALTLYENLPVIYGADELSGVAALRWKCQLNENSKMVAFANVFPEVNHNEISGLANPALLAEKIRVVLLRDRQDHPQVLRRMEITRDLIVDDVGGVTEVWAEGHSELARVFSLMFLGDYLSLYLAVLNDVDPSSDERTDMMKQRVRES